MDPMRLNIDRSPLPPLMEPEIGFVYAVQGGSVRGPRYMVIIAISQNTAYLLTFGIDGHITNATQYGVHALRDRAPIGRLVQMPQLDVEWFQ